MITIYVNFSGNTEEWIPGPDSYARMLREVLLSIPQVREFLAQRQDEVPKELRSLGWGWIGPSPEDFANPDWDSPGLDWAFGPGRIEVLRG